MVVDLKRKESDLIEQLQGHSKADEAFLISSSYVLELANKADELFEKSQDRQKNELLRFVLANASVEGEKLVYKLKTPFAGIVLCNETNDWLPHDITARTLVDACSDIELKVIYVGQFPCWKDEVSLMRKERVRV